jgi:tetratricopeptide (TPR) repeat protein
MARGARDDDERAPLGLPACETGEDTIAPEPPPDRDPTIDGLPARFQVRRVVGRGGMGIVVAAYDSSLDREVAIKLIRIERHEPRMRERFLREARAAAPLHARGIVQVHDIDPDGKYIVMELVHGESLAARLARETRLTGSEVVRIGRALAEALAVAHAAGIVHRDVKPGNILLGEADVKLADFGVAFVADSELTGPGAQVGTPAYMAPEQLRGQELDARADVYAAGATLFRAAVGTGLDDDRDERAVAADVFAATGDHGLADVIARAVRPDRAARFADGGELLAALTEASRVRSPRLRRLVLSIVGAGVVAGGAWYVVRDRAPTPDSIGLVAVAPISSTTWSYAAQPPNSAATSDVLAILLGEIDGLHAVGASDLDNASDHSWVDAARSLGARFLVSGTVEQRSQMFHASIELRSLGDAGATRFELDAVALPALMNEITEQVAHRIAPDRTLRHGPSPRLARLLFARGEPRLARLDFAQARPFLDQAVDADPAYFDAWYALASARAWMMAPEPEVRQAIEIADQKAGPGPKKQLLDGASRVLHRDYPGARAVLEPLVDVRELAVYERRDALYYLGEANWHDGRHAAAAGFFRRALELDSRFKPPAIHLGEYALARRDHTLAVYLGGILEEPNQEPYEFMQGHYDALARTGTTRFRVYARLVLGQAPSPEDEKLVGDEPIYRVAVALGAEQPAAARRAIDALWAPILEHGRDAAIADSTYHQLTTFADVLLCAGEIDALRRVVQFMADRSKRDPVHGYQRISILAAALVGDRTWIVREGLTERDATLADAIDAELNGDRRRAADLLSKLVADPTSSWDYPERVALLRNLRALRRDKDARALCDDTLHPAVFTWAYLPTRRQCGALTAVTGSR